MPSALLKVDSNTSELIVKLRTITTSIPRIIERALEVTDPEGIAPPAYTHKTHMVTLPDEVHTKLKGIAEFKSLSITDALSAIVQKYVWSIKEGLDQREVVVSTGSIGVSLKPEHANLLDKYMKENDRTFGYVLKRAIKDCLSGEVEMIAPDGTYRMGKKGAVCAIFYTKITEAMAEKLTILMGDSAVSRSAITRAVVISFLDHYAGGTDASDI